jgi:methyltransferase-like protein
MNPYDAVPYDSLAFHETHPDHLASLARLCGLEPPPVATARVLEIGCASGGNLMPMACVLPHARFLGIDPSRRQIAEGQATIDALSIPNLRLEAVGIEDLDPRLGPFDYILVHGVYSWVPAPVRDRLMAAISSFLAPRGVAFVSYNVYPGWHVSSMLRQMMLYQTAGIDEPSQRIRLARDLIETLAAAQPDPSTPHAQTLRGKAALLREKPDSYLLHEHLEAVNDPLHFHEFASHAARHNLRILADASPIAWPDAQPPEVRQALDHLAGDDPIRREQHLDFLLNRSFRRSLLIHTANRPRPDRVASAPAVLRFRSSCRAASPTPDLAAGVEEDYLPSDGRPAFTTSHPTAKAALSALDSAWPSSLTFADLEARAPGPLGPILTACFLHGLVELQSHEPPVDPTAASSHPLATAYARLEATRGPRVTNMLHRVVDLGQFDRLILSRLDGSRDRPALALSLTNAVVSGELELTVDGRTLADRAQITAHLLAALEVTLPRLGRGAYLLRPA